MVEVNEALTRQVAKLARLELTDAEAGTYSRQLRDILKYIDQLQELDVSGVEPMTHPLDLGAPMREDEIRPYDSAAIRDCAPGDGPLEDGGFRVPQILG